MLAATKTVGGYEILRELGHGGMATVYLARQTDLDRFVALKELAAFHAADPSFALRFVRESRLAGSLSHPNIVTVHEYLQHEGTPYLAMEYLEYGSLRRYMGQLTLAQIGGVFEGLLAGLAHAEAHGIVHRDLKPENLMVTADGGVKITDFGIARTITKMQTDAFVTATGTTVGTPAYMAPEQAMAQAIGPWTDLYSVGCMAFELLSGHVPFHDSTAPMALLMRHATEAIPPVKSIRPKVDQRISDWIERLLVKEPAQRTQRAEQAWVELEETLLDLEGPRWRRGARLLPSEEPAPVIPAEPPSRRRRTPPAAMLAAGIAVTGAAVILGLSDRPTMSPAPAPGAAVSGNADATNDAYARRLSSTVTALRRDGNAAAADLRHARRRTTQIRAVRRLAAAHSRAARALAGDPADVEANTALVDALARIGTAYDRAGRAGARGRRTDFKRHGSRAAAAHADLEQALARLAAAGYPRPGTINAAPLPTLRAVPTRTPTPEPTVAPPPPPTPTPSPTPSPPPVWTPPPGGEGGSGGEG